VAASDRTKVHDGLDSNVLISWTTPFGADADAQAALADQIAAEKAREDTVTVSLEMNNQRAAADGHRTEIGGGGVEQRLRRDDPVVLFADDFRRGRFRRQGARHPLPAGTWHRP
jgi:hypothetical protein